MSQDGLPNNLRSGRTHPPLIVAQHRDPATIVTSNTNATAASLTTMSWTGQSGALTGDPAYRRTGHPSSPDTAPLDPPPDYSLPIPTETLTYTFSTTNHDAMIILPPSSAHDPQPLFHISVSLNPIIPHFSTTTLCRGETFEGTVIARVEWGDASSCLISIGLTSHLRSDVLQHVARSTWAPADDGFDRMDWRWAWPDDSANKLYWIERGSTAKCYLMGDSWGRANEHQDKPIAEFSGRTTITTFHGLIHPPITLTVTPDGHVGSRLHYIILSALIIERTRHPIVPKP